MKRAAHRRPYVLYLLLISLTAPISAVEISGLPTNPEDWVCADPNPVMDPKEWCGKERTRRAPAELPTGPEWMSDVAGKNAFDSALKDFLVGLEYREKGLDWYGDMNWRLTGPIVGALPSGGEFSGSSYGAHPAVRIYYSPEVMDWLCSGREGQIEPGAMIIKEMRNLEKTAITAPDNCMEITADQEPTSWAVMVKGNGETADDWYWANPTNSRNDPGKPTCSNSKHTSLLVAIYSIFFPCPEEWKKIELPS